MTKLSIRPPKVYLNAKGKGFWKQIGMIVIGTTISLVLTIVAAKLMEVNQRAKDRRLSAMMVMSNIEVFARNAEELSEYLASNDSVATWLLNKPIEDLELLPPEELNGVVDQATVLPFLSRDKSAENIFSNNIETWKNMGNVQFIDKVGQCFSTMSMVEEYWNKRVTDINNTILDIKDHPSDYEGSSIPIKILRTEKMRRSLNGIHYLRAWFSHVAATMRYYNRYNMESIGITEQEVIEYTAFREKGDENQGEEPDFNDFYSDPISPDSLSSMHEYDARLEELRGGK